MKKGKVSESILKRSVLRQIKNKRDEIVKGAGVGVDCAFLSLNHKMDGVRLMTAISTQTVTLPVGSAGQMAVYSAVNNLAAGGGDAVAVTVSIVLPYKDEEVSENFIKGASSTELLLKDIMGRIELSCRELHLQVAGGHTEVSQCVLSPVVTVTALGYAKENEKKKTMNPYALDLVMSKWAGLEGTVILAQEKENELQKRYPLHLIGSAQEFERYLSVIPEAATAVRSGVYGMHDIRSGGVFGALWEMSQMLGVGLSVDLKKIPVRQETIEICEYFNLNPYELLSGGALLMAAPDGEKLVKDLNNEGIFAAVIGTTAKTNDKIIHNEEEIRYLEPAKPDEINKIVFKVC